MKRSTLLLALAATLCLGVPRGLNAQVGAVIDFINKLSGPRMVGVAGSYFFTPGERIRARIGLAYLGDIGPDEALEPDDAAVKMFSIKPAAEVQITGPLEASIGFSLHRFSGDFDDAFWHWSIPVQLQGRFPIISDNGEGKLFLRAALGLEYFPEFGADDFDPIDTGVSIDGGELVFPRFEVGVDWAFRRRSNLPGAGNPSRRRGSGASGSGRR